MLLSPAISFELPVKVAEEIDLERCNFRNFRSQPPDLDLDSRLGHGHIGVHIRLRSKLDRNQTNLLLTKGRTDRHS